MSRWQLVRKEKDRIVQNLREEAEFGKNFKRHRDRDINEARKMFRLSRAELVMTLLNFR